MKDSRHFMPEACPETSETVQTVSLEVDPNPPRLQLKRALPWDALFQVMTFHWRPAGKNVDGGAGLSWEVSLYGPLVVLMLVKQLHSREMEAYRADNVVARVFIGRSVDPSPQIRDHSNIARAYMALGTEGLDAVGALSIKSATGVGFAEPTILSSDMTAQALPIGYPNEPGIWRGLAQRCGRALRRRQGRGGLGVASALAPVQTIVRTGTAHHRFAQDQGEKRRLLSRLLREVGQWVVQTRPMIARFGQSRDRGTRKAMATLSAMAEVARVLIPQIMQWLTTTVVAKGKILHAGIPQARSMGRNKVGKQVELGLPYLLSRLGGGYGFGRLSHGVIDEHKMPLAALEQYRERWGAEATPELVVYDRAGDATTTRTRLAHEGVKPIGIQPKGPRPWQVAEEVRQQGRSERGTTDGIIGTLTSNKYGFNKPKERLWQTLEMAGLRSIISFNLNKLMRDLVPSRT